MRYEFVTPQNRASVTAFIAEHWLATEMIIRGEVVDMTQVDGIVVFDHEKIVALLTYRITGGICEITSLDSLLEGRGIASSLIERMIAIAREQKCQKVIVVTTNDNIHAIRFYQKRGFDMARLYHNALDVSRKLKPEIPLIGENGIPLRHEIEFEFPLA